MCFVVIDHSTQQYWLFDASMQLSEQWRRFGGILSRYTLAGIFLTHAHVGHYLGMPYVGKECHNSKEVIKQREILLFFCSAFAYI